MPPQPEVDAVAEVAIAEALERSARVRHVYVHAGGKIEALGTATEDWSNGAPDAGSADMMAVTTICTVDCRDNAPSANQLEVELEHRAGAPIGQYYSTRAAPGGNFACWSSPNGKSLASQSLRVSV